MRTTSTWWEYAAFCWVCDFHALGKNALGLAAQHHDRTGHYVTIDASGSISYGETPDDGPAPNSAAEGGICITTEGGHHAEEAERGTVGFWRRREGGCRGEP